MGRTHRSGVSRSPHPALWRGDVVFFETFVNRSSKTALCLSSRSRPPADDRWPTWNNFPARFETLYEFWIVLGLRSGALNYRTGHQHNKWSRCDLRASQSTTSTEFRPSWNKCIEAFVDEFRGRLPGIDCLAFAWSGQAAPHPRLSRTTARVRGVGRVPVFLFALLRLCESLSPAAAAVGRRGASVVLCNYGPLFVRVFTEYSVVVEMHARAFQRPVMRTMSPPTI